MSDLAMNVHDAPRPDTELIFHRVSWGAIFSGTLVALAMEIVFLSFGMFIGFQMTGGAHAWSEAWYFVTLFCSLFAGSAVASRLAGNPSRGNGMLHGFVVWGLTMFTTAAIAVVLLWDVIRVANSWLQTMMATVPQAPPIGHVTRAASVAGDLSTLSLVIWGGMLAAIAGSLLGGAGAIPKEIFLRRQFPQQPHRV